MQTNRVLCNHGLKIQGKENLPEKNWRITMPQEPLTIIVEGNLIPNHLSDDGIINLPKQEGRPTLFMHVGHVLVEMANRFPRKSVEITVNDEPRELECYKVCVRGVGHIRYSVWRHWDAAEGRFRFRAGDVPAEEEGYEDESEENPERIFSTLAEARFRLHEIMAKQISRSGVQVFTITYHPSVETD